MPTSLSNLVDNLSEINKEECKACRNVEINESECDLLDMKIVIYVLNVKNVKEYD